MIHRVPGVFEWWRHEFACQAYEPPDQLAAAPFSILASIPTERPVVFAQTPKIAAISLVVSMSTSS